MVLFVFGIIAALFFIGALFVAILSNKAEEKFGAGLVAVVALIATTLFLVFSMARTVDNGKVGIPVVFGKAHDGELYPGLHFVSPWTGVHQMSTQTEEYTITLDPAVEEQDESAIWALSKDSLVLRMDITIWYRIEASEADVIFRTIGDNYLDKVIRPAIRTSLREVVKDYTGMEAVTTARDELQFRVEDQTNTIMATVEGSDGIIIERINLRNISLPDVVVAAIDQKVAALQEAEMMVYKLQKAEKEAEIRVVEAQGLAEAQHIIDASLTDNYLVFKYIDTLDDLISSPNTTFVIAPFDQNLVPLLNVNT